MSVNVYVILCFLSVPIFVQGADVSWYDYKDCVGKTENASLRLFPQEPDCGTTRCPIVTGRIKGGKDADLGEFPWMATIIVHYSPSFLKVEWFTLKTQRCGGSIINNKHILTAGHCFLVEEENFDNFFDLDISGVKAFVGDWDLSRDPDNFRGKTPPSRLQVKVEKIFFYPGYVIEKHRLWWDVALMRLETPITFNDYVKPICLPFGCDEAIRWRFERNPVVIAGWGLYKRGDELPHILQYALTAFSWQRECKEAWARAGQELKEFHVCVEAKFDTQSCNGDSGGPVMVRKVREDNRSLCTSYNMGVLSFGRYHCTKRDEKELPKVYTWVPSILDWIVKNVKD